jgi:NAD+ kinase
VTSVFVVAHQQRSEAAALALAATDWLRNHGHDVWMSPDDAKALGLPELGDERDPRIAGLALSLGGDGTTLRTVKMLDGAPVPIIGVNVGLLGYLTEIEPPGVLAALERWFSTDEASGGWRIEERMMLQVSVQRSGADRPSGQWRALNEVVLEKGESGHTVRLEVCIDGSPFTSYAADGLIVATPTGSTAYSLSARGPVVSPQHRAILLTPVSPHMLFDRSLVLDPDEPVSIEVIGYRPVEVSIDGQRVATLAEGDTVRCSPAAETARFVRFGPRRFHQILKAKFGLTDR